MLFSWRESGTFKPHIFCVSDVSERAAFVIKGMKDRKMTQVIGGEKERPTESNHGKW